MADPLSEPKLNMATIRALAREVQALRSGRNLTQGAGISIVHGKSNCVISASGGTAKKNRPAE
ncbi:MAG: hypothetical protein IT577_23700 [Verrucomicrobiae bacterium]|nr:hypothetical protein [Verrucomicrobiae bacterium]